uniref:Uncharacterized protein n=1 Tax=Anguilla anguilla TaxID=7936 RepID=A0A0E9RRP3_ANGAN
MSHYVMRKSWNTHRFKTYSDPWHHDTFNVSSDCTDKQALLANSGGPQQTSVRTIRCVLVCC